MRQLINNLFFIIFISSILSFSAQAKQENTPSTRHDVNKDTSIKVATYKDRDDIDHEDVPEDKFNRGQPRASLQGFLVAAQESDFLRATAYMDFRNVNQDVLDLGKEELARELYIVLSRNIIFDTSDVSDLAEGDLSEQHTPSYREVVGSIKTKQGTVNILLQRVPRQEDRVRIWKISNSTVGKIPRLKKEYSYTPLGEWLFEHLPAVSFIGIMLWQWVYIFGLFLIIYSLSMIATLLFTRLLIFAKINITSETKRFIEKPFSFFLATILLRVLTPEANYTLASKSISEGATLLTIASMWLLFSFVDLLKVKMGAYFVSQNKPLVVFLLRPAGTLIKSLIAIITVLIWFENLGFSATTLLAGLGIGGLAIALAAQKTVENIIGAVTLYTSAPVKVGDLCGFDNTIGTVEEIGLRSTRIRTLDRTVIYVPNAKFIDMLLENYSEREKMAYKPKLFLSAQTKHADIESFLASLLSYLKEQPLIEQSPLRAHFKNYNVKGLELDVLLYIRTTNFDVYLEEINGINFKILALLEQNNCQLNVISDRQ